MAFITNEGDASLKTRITELLVHSKELRLLVGFFYFSGIRELYTSLRDNPNSHLDVLVGLSVDKTMHGLVEFDLVSTRFSYPTLAYFVTQVLHSGTVTDEKIP